MHSTSQFADLAPHYDELMQVVPYDDWVEYVMTLFAFAGHKPRRVLDCACGTGNVTFELARRGLETVGVDLSAPMIQAALDKLAVEHVTSQVAQAPFSLSSAPTSFAFAPRFFQADLSDFDLGERFDCATCLYDSLNYILDPKTLEAAFSRIAAHLEIGGAWVFDMNSEFALTQDLFTQSNFDARKKLHYDWHALFDSETSICTVSMRFERETEDGTTETFNETHRERAYSPGEIEAMLGRTGWNLLHSFDAYTLNPIHNASERWFFVAQRIR